VTAIEDEQLVLELTAREVAFALTKQANLMSSEERLRLDKGG
jgi:hypothetical protein